MSLSLAIITGATHNPRLAACLESVNGLAPDPRVAALEHWIVVDGASFEAGVKRICDATPPREGLTRRVLVLPHNTGRDGGAYLCHRIIAATSYLVPTGWWMQVLDEDNALAPNHLAAITDAMERVPDARWGYTLRKIVSESDPSETVCDTVESMGLIRLTCLGSDRIPDRLVDTNCYVIRSDLTKELAPIWGCTTARHPEDLEADRKVIHTLAQHEPKAWCTREFTVEYTAGNRPDSVSMSFFKNSDVMPWDPARRDLYVFHFDYEKTRQAIQPGAKNPLAEWCLTLYDAFRDRYNLINGFECVSGLPHDATCFLAMCRPETLPLDHLRRLKTTTHPGITRILYTLEGPNKRHQAQWTVPFLKEAADIVLTYARPVLENSEIKTVECPHNSRFLGPDTIRDACRVNKGPNRGTAAMVLEPRPGTDEYTIDGRTYTSLDGLRRDVATGWGPDLTVVGHGWTEIVNRMSDDEKPRIGYDIPRMTDTKTPVDTYLESDYAVILENTDCPGYVSEKVGDALLAGAIPIYDGRSLDWISDATTETAVPRDQWILWTGKGQWWLDIRDAATWQRGQRPDLEGAPQGRVFREYLHANYYATPEMIQLLKSRVRDVRESYLLAKGTETVFKSFEASLAA